MIHDDRLPLSPSASRRATLGKKPVWAGLVILFAVAFAAPATALAENCYPADMYRDHWKKRNIFDTMKRSEKRLMPLPREVAQAWTTERRKSFWRGASFAEFDIWWREGALIKIRKDAWRARTERSPARKKRFVACKKRNKAAAKRAREAAAAREIARKKKMFDEYFAKKARYYTSGEVMCLNRECRQCKGGRCVAVGMLGDLHKNPAICPGTDPSKDLKDNRSLCRTVRRDRERAANPSPPRRRPRPRRRRSR